MFNSDLPLALIMEEILEWEKPKNKEDNETNRDNKENKDKCEKTKNNIF